MGHLAMANGVYVELARRLDRFPIGAPPSKQLYEILKILYSEEEAQVAAQFPMGRVTFEQLQERVKMEPAKLRAILESLAEKALIIDIPRGDKTFYILMPGFIGFFEFTFMRLQSDLPLKKLAHLMHDYMHHGGMGQEFFASHTRRARTFVVESAVSHFGPQVLPYERASEVIREARYGALTTCYCRHKARHRGTACTAPLKDICTVLGTAAEFLVRRGYARKADAAEMLDVLDMTEELGLCHLGDNVQERVGFICHCCRCCCELLAGYNKLGIRHPVAPSNFVSFVDQTKCTGCKTCLKRCPVRAISLETITVDGRKEQRARVDESICLGCGLCNAVCWVDALTMRRRKEPVITPATFREQQMLIAAEKGKLSTG
ncbi:MAG: indolepyruvate ferredoxin oxidoreductase subunit alpha [Anaerolineae bacterium]